MSEERELRERLIDCAMDMLSEAVPEELTLRAVARRAGVSHGAPRRHYATWGALLAAVAARGFVELRDRLDPVLKDETRRPARRLYRAAQVYAEFAVQQPGLFSVMFRHDLLHAQGSALRATSLPVFQDIVAAVRAAQADAGCRDDLPADRLAAALWSAVHGVLQLWLWGALPLALGESDPAPLVDTTVDLILAHDGRLRT